MVAGGDSPLCARKAVGGDQHLPDTHVLEQRTELAGHQPPLLDEVVDRSLELDGARIGVVVHGPLSTGWRVSAGAIGGSNVCPQR